MVNRKANKGSKKDKEEDNSLNSSKKEKKSGGKRKRENLDRCQDKNEPQPSTSSGISEAKRQRTDLKCKRNLQIQFNSEEDTRSISQDQSDNENSNAATVDFGDSADLHNLETFGIRTPRDLMKHLKKVKSARKEKENDKQKGKKEIDQKDEEEELLDYDDDILMSVSGEEDAGLAEECSSNMSSEDEYTETVTEIVEEKQTSDSKEKQGKQTQQESMEQMISRIIAKQFETQFGSKKENDAKNNCSSEMVKDLARNLKGPLQKDFDRKGENVNINSNLNKNKIPVRNEITKSPSDTTVYSPALRQKRLDSIGKAGLDLGTIKVPLQHNTNTDPMIKRDDAFSQSSLLNQINDFVERVRLESAARNNVDDAIPSTSTGERGGRNNDQRFQQQLLREQTREQELAEQAIINAERFKADINSSGMNNENSVPPVDLNFDDNKDEEFSEGTCHVDQQNIVKVCKGQFVEVAKLIPKQQTLKNDENKRIEFVNKDGMTYYIPSANEKEQKITNVRKWESGFKVYAAIYSKANPHRGAEIWQYIHTINLAASSYHWDNVAYYDFMFRQQMAKYPQRSWRKINHQLWSLAMRDPINSKASNFGQNPGYSQNGQKRDFNKDNCCWRYNRNKCNRSSRECRYEHRCSLCGSHNHILLNCPKNRRNNNNSQGNGGESSQNTHNNDKKTQQANKNTGNSGNSSQQN